MNNVLHLLEVLEHRAPTRIPARDRYRAPRRHDEPVYDMVEDDDEYQQEIPFDSFDQELLQQPYEDRQRQASQGRARLSLAPKTAKFFPDGASSQHQNSSRVGQLGYPQQRTHDLSQFAYGATQPHESSPDAHLGASSSPAFKASQRRAENHQMVTPHRPKRTQAYEEEPQAAVSHQRLEISLSRPQFSQKSGPNWLDLPHAPPVVQGIPLVLITELPNRLQTVFPFPTFNAVQSKCFDNVYKSDDNFVLASPTGSGKTALLELAICRAVVTKATSQYKIIYQAPTKALCSERQRDWQKKFRPLGLNCIELTGDSDSTDLRNVQTANIIITTPEKWDSITRKWKDHEKLMRLIKLFLIDEVHILKEDRGAVLETVVSRMKTIGTDVRFVALSATVPNLGDVATWLGRNAAEPYEPAINERFGEEFRPVKLRRHVCGYNNTNPNDWMFEKTLESRLPEVIAKYSERKPIMVFCCTRKSTVSTAKMLASWWTSKSPRERYWSKPSNPLQFQDRDLCDCVASGVAFHHAGLDPNDRLGVETGFLKGDINVICCTSTLAVGVNLPCHFVIIKNTVTFTNTGLQEYADLEIMQMLGRAGRPQFDDNAIAVIMTRQTKVRRYEMMMTGQEMLESTLHLNLIDHLNAEVGLGTIHDLTSARKWLAGTFLYVRLKQNPGYYKLGGMRSEQGIDEQLDDICVRDMTLLQDTDLVSGGQRFRCTDFGNAMARYYVHFETMRVFMGLQPKASLSEILSAIVQATEFERMRFRAGEKNFYKNLNKSPSIRFPIPVNLALPAHKVSLLMQSVLGAADVVWDGEMQKHRAQYTVEVSAIFRAVNRLIRCIIDCQISLGDSVSIRNALLLERSVGARVWDDSPLQMKQIPQVGVVSVRKLVNAGIRSVEELECTEARRIEVILGKNPPFGLKLLDQLKLFPKLRVSLHVQPNSVAKTGDGVKVQVEADIGFMNERPPRKFGEKLVYVCLLAETSDGRKVHFARISGQKLGQGQTLTFPALLTSADQCINCYVMCDEFAGTMREATVRPTIAPSMFPTPKRSETVASVSPHRPARPTPNMSRRRIESADGGRRPSGGTDEFGDDGIDDDELVKASFGDLDFDHIDNYAPLTDTLTRNNTTKNTSTKGKGRANASEKPIEDDDDEPRQLENGKWACNHKCKDKNACKHMCCRDGLENPPKKYTKKFVRANETSSQASSKNLAAKGKKTQTKLQLTASKQKSSAPIEELDLTRPEKKRKTEYAMSGPRDYRHLYQLHESIQKTDPPASISSVMHKKPKYCYAEGGEHDLSFLKDDALVGGQDGTSSDYGDIQLDDISLHSERPESSRAQRKISNRQEVTDFHTVNNDRIGGIVSDHHSDGFGDDDSIFRDVMVGLADSQDLQAANRDDDEDMRALEESLDIDYEVDLRDEDVLARVETAAEPETEPPFSSGEFLTLSTVQVPAMPPEDSRSLFFNNTSSPAPPRNDIKSARSMLKGPAPAEPKQAKEKPRRPRTRTTGQDMEIGSDENSRINLPEAREKTPVPDGYKDLEPWLFAEFGDIVELVDG